MKTIGKIFYDIKLALKSAEILEYEQESELILMHILSFEGRHDLYHNKDNKVNDVELDAINEIVQKRISSRKPIQYILAKTNFYGLNFVVDESVLIPRFDTEVLVYNCLKILKQNEEKNIKILDICTGSGCIAITIARELANCSILATDISEMALRLAKKNASINEVENLIKFRQSDLFDNVKEKFFLIVSNPPYISSKDYNELEKELFFEPQNALESGETGFEYYDKIIDESKNFLIDGGFLAFETGYNQAELVKEKMEKSGFEDVTIYKDLGGRDRNVIGKYTCS